MTDGPGSPGAAARARRSGPATVVPERLRELILDGTYAPGERLPPERTLAVEFGVSRAAIREAISELAGLNIVTARRGSGTYVNGLNADHLFAPLDFALTVDPEMVLHLFELRRIVEPVGAALAAARITDERLADLRDLFAAYDAAYQEHRWDELIGNDEAIHLAIAEGAGNPLLIAVLRSIAGAAHRARLITAALPTTPPGTHSELMDIVDGIGARDPLWAEAAMLRHLKRIEQDARRRVGASHETASPSRDGPDLPGGHR